MKKELFYEILDDDNDSINISFVCKMKARDIEEMMDKELRKSPSEMDVNLIKRCLDALTEKGSSQPKIKLYKSIVARICVFIMVITIVIFFSYPALFTYLDVPMPEFLKHVYQTVFNIDFLK